VVKRASLDGDVSALSPRDDTHDDFCWPGRSHARVGARVGVGAVPFGVVETIEGSRRELRFSPVAAEGCVPTDGEPTRTVLVTTSAVPLGGSTVRGAIPAVLVAAGTAVARDRQQDDHPDPSQKTSDCASGPWRSTSHGRLSIRRGGP